MYRQLSTNINNENMKIHKYRVIMYIHMHTYKHTDTDTDTYTNTLFRHTYNHSDTDTLQMYIHKHTLPTQFKHIKRVERMVSTITTN